MSIVTLESFASQIPYQYSNFCLTNFLPPFFANPPPQPPVTNELILRLQSCSEEELVKILKSTTVWRYGKVEEAGLLLWGW